MNNLQQQDICNIIQEIFESSGIIETSTGDTLPKTAGPTLKWLTTHLRVIIISMASHYDIPLIETGVVSISSVLRISHLTGAQKKKC